MGYDPVITTTSAEPPVTTMAGIQAANLTSMLESLAALQPALQNTALVTPPQLTPQLTPQGSINSLLSPPPQLDILVPPLSLSTPLITLPFSTMSVSPANAPDALLSPLSLHSQLSPLSLASSLSLHSLPSSSQYNPLPGANISPLFSPSALGAFSPPSSQLSSSQLSPMDAGPSAFSRRQSAPETLLTPQFSGGEQRRYSDFHVQTLLRRPSLGGVEQRRTSVGGRKPRTIYGAKQTEVLEEVFSESNYMVGPERELLAQRLGLTESQVRVWFQNRRSKKRKRLQIEQAMQEKQKQPGTSHDI